MRRGILIGLGALAALVLLLAGAVMLLPAERIGAFAATRASAALDREVRVARFGVRLLPRPAIALTDVSIAGAAPGDSALLSAARVDLRPRLLPLLRRKVIVEEVVLEQPVIRIAVAADGSTNLPHVAGDTASTPGDAELSIRRLRIEDGAIAYTNAQDSTHVSLSGLTQSLRLSGAIRAGGLDRIDAAGVLAIDDIDIDAPARLAWPIHDMRLHVAHDIAIDRSADRIDLNSLAVTLQELQLDVSGSITALSDSLTRTVDLQAHTGNVDVARFVASLPRALREGKSGDALTGAAGRVQLDLAVQGRAGAGSIPAVNGQLTLNDAALERGRHGLIASGLAGRVTFSLDSAATDGITGTLLGEPLHIAMRLRNPSAPEGTVAIRAALALAQAQKLGLLPDSVRGSGRIALDITAAGALAEPAAVMLAGTVDLTGVELRTAALQRPVVVQQGRIELNGQRATAKDLRAAIGASDVALDLDASDWLPYALGDTLQPPVVAFDARSANFDADEMLGARTEKITYGQLFFARLADRTIDGRTAAEVAEELGLRLPDVPHITLDGRIRAARFVRGAVPFNDVDITVAARGGELEVRAGSFRMMDGGVTLTGRLGLAAAGSPDSAAQPLAVDYSVSDVAAGPFLERYTGFRDNISGTLLLVGSMTMYLDQHLLPVRESVTGAGTVAVLNGEIVNWPLLRKLGERIGVARFDTLSFRAWTGRYSLTGPRIVLEESALESGDLGVRAAGTFDVNGTLDLGATMHMPQAWVARVPGAPAAILASAAAGDDGRVPVGARFTGSARDPAVSLDMSEAGARVASAAREAAEQKAREAATTAAAQVLDRVPRDSVTAAADSARKKVESAIGDRLKRIIRPGGGN